MQEAIITNFYSLIWSARRKIGLSAVIGLVIGIVWINTTPPVYLASVLLAPSSNSSTGVSPLGGLAGAARLAGISSLSGGGTNQFTRFQALINSRALAEVLAHNPNVMHTVFSSKWDVQANAWKRPSGPIFRFKSGLMALLGRGTSSIDPNAEQLAGFFDRNLTQNYSVTTGLFSLSLKFSDPGNAVMLLRNVHRQADNILRQAARIQSTARINYLRKTLPTVSVVEQRTGLIGLLNNEEQTNMTIESDPNFAADVIDAPSSSTVPIWPNAPLMFGLALIGSIFAGLIWHYFGTLITFMTGRWNRA